MTGISKNKELWNWFIPEFFISRLFAGASYMEEIDCPYHKNLASREREALLRDLRAYLEPRPELVFAYVYGSFYAGMPFQDIDLALYVDPKNLGNVRSLEERYAEILSDIFREIFHVVIINHAPSNLLCSIFSEGRKLFSKDDGLLQSCIEQCSLDMLANEGVSRQSLEEIVS